MLLVKAIPIFFYSLRHKFRNKRLRDHGFAIQKPSGCGRGQPALGWGIGAGDLQGSLPTPAIP